MVYVGLASENFKQMEGCTVFVPNLVQDKFVDEQGYLTPEWRSLFDQLLQNMQQNLSNEGYVVPSQTASDIAIIQAGTNPDGSYIAQNGTLIFDTSAVNGGSIAVPNGQLYIRLNDNTFHPITN